MNSLEHAAHSDPSSAPPPPYDEPDEGWDVSPTTISDPEMHVPTNYPTRCVCVNSMANGWMIQW